MTRRKQLSKEEFEKRKKIKELELKKAKAIKIIADALAKAGTKDKEFFDKLTEDKQKDIDNAQDALDKLNQEDSKDLN